MREKAITAHAFSGYFAFGYSVLVFSALIPAIEKALNLTHAHIGTALSLGAVGFFVASILYGILLERFEAFIVILSGWGIFLLGNLLLGLASSYSFLLIGTIMLNFGSGSVEVTIPFTLSMKSGSKGKTLNLSHSAFALGALAGPAFTSSLMKTLGNWRWAFISSLFFSTLPLIFLLKGRVFLRDAHSHYLLNEEGVFLHGLLNKIYILLLLVLSMYVGYEMGFSTWLSVFLHEVKDYPIPLASLYPSFLWLGLFLGRLFCASAADRVGYGRWLNLVVAFSLVFSTITVAVARKPLFIMLSVFLTGFWYATTYPTIQAMIVAMLRGGKAIGLSIAAASTSAFSALASFVIGQIGTRFGIFYGVLVILLFNVLALTIALALSMLKNREHF